MIEKVIPCNPKSPQKLEWIYYFQSRFKNKEYYQTYRGTFDNKELTYDNPKYSPTLVELQNR